MVDCGSRSENALLFTHVPLWTGTWVFRWTFVILLHTFNIWELTFVISLINLLYVSCNYTVDHGSCTENMLLFTLELILRHLGGCSVQRGLWVGLWACSTALQTYTILYSSPLFFVVGWWVTPTL